MTQTTRIVKPLSITASMLLTAIAPISHHDPAKKTDSNALTFNRAAVLLARESVSASASPEVSARFAAAHPVPAELAPVFDGVTFGEFAAVVLLKTVIDTYNGAEGQGLFSGIARYQYLESRAETAAIKSSSLRSFWAAITDGLLLPLHAMSVDAALIELWSLPKAVQAGVLSAIRADLRGIITIARTWCDMAKTSNVDYAARTGKAATSDEMTVLDTFSHSTASERMERIEIPAISANSVRHQAARRPGFDHLMDRLGFPVGTMLMPSAEAIFENGGNMRAGAKEPAGSSELTQQIRETFPILDLLGGVADGFTLGASKLAVSTLLVCRENQMALRQYGYDHLSNSDVSAFDLLDDVTLTHQKTQQGVGQMIFNFETLVPGTQIVARFVLDYPTKTITVGALAAALETYIDNPRIGGQGARGFGSVAPSWLEHPEIMATGRDEYEASLEANRDELRQAIVFGTLGSKAQVLA